MTSNFLDLENNRCNEQVVPWVKQYLEIKKDHTDKLLLYRMGDFYELFFEDADKAAVILGLNKTVKGSYKGSPISMAGFPSHSIDHHLEKLIYSGESVALCEQVEDSNNDKKNNLINRVVVRVFTPGTWCEFSNSSLEEGREKLLVSIFQVNSRELGFSTLDFGSGSLEIYCNMKINDFISWLSVSSPSEILSVASELHLTIKRNFKNIPVTIRSTQTYDFTKSNELIEERFGKNSLEYLRDRIDFNAAVCSIGSILSYLYETQKSYIPHLRAPILSKSKHNMVLDPSTCKNLEIFKTSNTVNNLSIFSILDKTNTPMGSRCLRKWMLNPLKDINTILIRQEMIKNFIIDFKEWQPLLKKVGDLERILSRIAMRFAKPLDWEKLKLSIDSCIDIIKKLQNKEKSIPETYFLPLKNYLNILENIKFIKDAFMDNLPSIFKEGKVIRDGYNSDLDYWRTVLNKGNNYLESIIKKERENNSFDSLKVGFSSLYGYYFQLNKSESLKAPTHYSRCQTLKNVERYKSSVLTEYEKEIVIAEFKAKNIEKEIYESIFDLIIPFIKELQKISDYIKELDVFITLAFNKVSLNLNFPTFNKNQSILLIKDSRHLLVEATHKTKFITNDINIDSKNSFMLITGPNMGGKSTYLRQAAITALLAQIGSAIPASSAELGIFNQIFTRIGASDDITSGRSTFMVEMTEVAYLLRNADNKSLVIVDEVGRGTTSQDGMAIAWAIAKELIRKRAITLFSTHFLEVAKMLTKHEQVIPLQINICIVDGELIISHKIVSGIASNAYGLEVAELSGIPSTVIKDAKSFKLLI